jgi:hypothetical protein
LTDPCTTKDIFLRSDRATHNLTLVEGEVCILQQRVQESQGDLDNRSVVNDLHKALMHNQRKEMHLLCVMHNVLTILKKGPITMTQLNTKWLQECVAKGDGEGTISFTCNRQTKVLKGDYKADISVASTSRSIGEIKIKKVANSRHSIIIF